MVGITLTPAQIRTAPPEVRRWLEREIASSLGLMEQTQAAPHIPPHLVGCGPEEVAAVYEAIRGMAPVANVFLELGRQGESTGRNGIEAHRLAELLPRTRLQNVQQLEACLALIDGVIRKIRGDATACICAVDQRGFCLVAEETQRSIAWLWSQFLSAGSFEASQPQNDPAAMQAGMIAQAAPPGVGSPTLTPMAASISDNASAVADAPAEGLSRNPVTLS